MYKGIYVSLCANQSMHLPVENYIWLKCGWTHYQCNSADVSWILRRFFDARGANRQTGSGGGGEVDMDRSCHILIQFLKKREGLQKKNQRHLTTTEETWNGFVLRVESCNRSAVYLPAAVLGCYLQIRRTMRGRGGWKAVRQSDESPGDAARVSRGSPQNSVRGPNWKNLKWWEV